MDEIESWELVTAVPYGIHLTLVSVKRRFRCTVRRAMRILAESPGHALRRRGDARLIHD